VVTKIRKNAVLRPKTASFLRKNDFFSDFFLFFFDIQKICHIFGPIKRAKHCFIKYLLTFKFLNYEQN